MGASTAILITAILEVVALRKPHVFLNFNGIKSAVGQDRIERRISDQLADSKHTCGMSLRMSAGQPE
jgi:hypothetical protein